MAAVAVSVGGDATGAAAPVATCAAAAAATSEPAVLAVSPEPTRKRSAGEEQWFLARQTRKAAKQRLDEATDVVQQLAAERDAVVDRLDRQHAAAEAARKDAKRHHTRSVASMRSLSQVIFDIED